MIKLDLSDIIINRIDQYDIQKYFISKEAIEVMKLLDEKITQDKHELRKLVLKQWPHEELLRVKKLRNLILELLYEEEAEDLAKKLNLEISGDNVYKRLLNTTFTKNGQRENILFKFFGESIPEHEEQYSTRPSVEITNVKKELFSYQRQAFEDVVSYLIQSTGRKRCLLHMPTGSGKTTTAMRVVASFFVTHKPSRIIWLAHSEELCEQAIEEFKETWNYVGDRNVQIIRFFKTHSADILEQTKEDKDVFIVAGLGKIFEAEKRQDGFLTTLADRIKLVVIDEAHQAVATTYKIILDQLIEKRLDNVALFGLSATPGRTENTKELAELFNHNKATIKTDTGDPIEYLIQEGHIARPKPKIVRSNARITEKELQRINLSKLDIPKKILEKLGLDTNRNFKIIIEIENLIKTGHKRIIFFAPSLRNSIDIFMILSARGHTAFHVDGNTPTERRENTIKTFQSNRQEPMVMCNFGVFTAGFDVPQISAVVIGRPTKSIVLYSQMVGRAMRGPRVGGNKKCEIRTITDINMSMFASIADNFFRWEELW